MTTNILLISDGRPGHFRQSEAITKALARRGPVSVERLEVRRRFHKNLDGRIRWLSKKGWLSPGTLLRIAYKGFSLPSERADIIVSAGGMTMPANLALAKLYSVPNVFSGSLRNAAPEDFSLILIPYAHLAGTPNHKVLLKPTPVDPDEMREPVNVTNERAPKKLVGALLIGGKADGYPYTPEDWDAVTRVVELGHTTGLVDWVVTTSNRTPDHVADALTQKCQEISSIKTFIDYRKAEAGSINDLLSASDFVICTEDSSSMVIEAICARRPTISIYPKSRRSKDIEDAMLEGQVTAGHLARLEIGPDLKERIGGALRRLTPMQGNHLDALADVIAPLLDKT